MDQSLTGIGDLLVGSLLIGAGFLGVALSLRRPSRVDLLLASFGAFTLLFGFRQLFSSDLMSHFGVSADATAWVISLSIYGVKIPAWIFLWKLLGRGWRSVIVIWLWIASSFAVVGVVSDFVAGTPGTLTGTPNNVVVIVGVLVLGAALLHYRRRMTIDQIVLTIGVVSYAVLALNQNLAAVGLVPWQPADEFIGVLLIVVSFGIIAARQFYANEKQLIALESELDTARNIQLSILPEGPPNVRELDIAVRFRPTSAVAGDLYDFLAWDESRVGVVLADVSGHGVPAALIASMVKVAITSQRNHGTRPAELLTGVNQTLVGNIPRGFVTATYVFVDCEHRVARVANGGHPHPLLWKSSTGAIEEVGGTGLILGRFASARFEEEEVILEPGDRIVLFTDGVVEAQNSTEEFYGDSRLKSLIGDCDGSTAEELCDALLDALRLWTGGKRTLSLDDDLTVVVVDFRR